jgi:hypothetical protein
MDYLININFKETYEVVRTIDEGNKLIQDIVKMTDRINYFY